MEKRGDMREISPFYVVLRPTLQPFLATPPLHKTDSRDSEKYQKRLFEKIDVLTSELRLDKELLMGREERRKKHGLE
jgi:hypothetical protein